jgi:hypothetical protein
MEDSIMANFSDLVGINGKGVCISLSHNFSISTSNETTIEFDTIGFLDDAYFSVDNGIITALKNCMVIVNTAITIYNVNTATEYHVYVKVNDDSKLWLRAPKEKKSDNFVHPNISGVIKLNKGDKIKVTTNNSGDSDFYIRGLPQGSNLSLGVLK